MIVKVKPFSWRCPFCDRDTTITGEDCTVHSQDLLIDNSDGPRRVFVRFVVCPNLDCKRLSLSLSIHELHKMEGYDPRTGKSVANWNLIPASKAKVFPSYIPQAILSDYTEACLIEELSPKASATLARRCLQGMIRDFWDIRKPRLIEEVEALKSKVDPLTWQAIDSVRSIGNIGAHMEKDINLIIGVDPDEARQLINLVEILLKDWYVAKHEREKSLKTVTEMGREKDSLKKQEGEQSQTS